ncbi:MAG: chorismate synthase [Bacteriovoracaceae bacterium]|nr:chorismate synthase [Bacteriovoracaceae bacterium]
MRGNTFGKLLSMTTFGESHGKAMGVIIDGLPPNLEISLNNLSRELGRRRPGYLPGTTSRNESDMPEILSGVFEGKTLGTPLCVIVKNKDQRSSDYESMKNVERPGHGDRTAMMKFGIRDYRGGGRLSGRETVSRVIAGHFASLVVPDLKIRAYASSIGDFKINRFMDDWFDDDLNFWPEHETRGDVIDYLEELKKEGESVGGKIAVVVDNCPDSLGEPVFDKLKADFAKALLSIGACTSFSIGAGEKMVGFKGSKTVNNPEVFGGIEGGISSGDRIRLEVTFKPPSTIGEMARKGRHDPCIVPRAVVVVESMIRFVIADHFLRQRAYRE